MDQEDEVVVEMPKRKHHMRWYDWFGIFFLTCVILGTMVVIIWFAVHPAEFAQPKDPFGAAAVDAAIPLTQHLSNYKVMMVELDESNNPTGQRYETGTYNGVL